MSRLEVNKNVIRIRDISEDSLAIAKQNAQISEEVAVQAARSHQTVDKIPRLKIIFSMGLPFIQAAPAGYN